MHEFFARVTPNDLVNISCQDTASGVTRLHRARLMERTDDGFLAKFEGETSLRPVEYNQIRERISLPWKPSALRDYLIIFRRRNATKEGYVEDLRTRRAFVQNLMQLLTLDASWRHNEEPGPMHQYYTGFDVLTDHEIAEVFQKTMSPRVCTLRMWMKVIQSKG